MNFLQSNQRTLRDAVASLRKRERRLARDGGAEQEKLEAEIQELEAEREFYVESLKEEEEGEE